MRRARRQQRDAEALCLFKLLRGTSKLVEIKR